jgi:hypothetical protein
MSAQGCLNPGYSRKEVETLKAFAKCDKNSFRVKEISR